MPKAVPPISPQPQFVRLTAGQLQLALRLHRCADLLAGIPLPPTTVATILNLIPPVVRRSETPAERIEVGGLKELTAALIRRLDPACSIDCVESQHLQMLPAEILGLLGIRASDPERIVRWLTQPSEWPRWMGDTQITGRTVGEILGVGREAGRRLLSIAHPKNISQALDPSADGDTTPRDPTPATDMDSPPPDPEPPISPSLGEPKLVSAPQPQPLEQNPILLSAADLAELWGSIDQLRGIAPLEADRLTAILQRLRPEPLRRGPGALADGDAP